MSDIHKAFALFHLEPGATRDAIKRRYHRLTKVWHPDRFETEGDKREAEEELKKINNANDIFKKHFESEHRDSGCVCQEPASTAKAEQRTHGPGPGQHTRPDPEAEARRRDEQRKHKTAADEATRKASEQQQPAEPQSSFTTAQSQQENLKWNKIRWQVAAGEAALFIALCIFGNFGYGVKVWWHDFTYQWERDHPPQQQQVPAPGSN